MPTCMTDIPKTQRFKKSTLPLDWVLENGIPALSQVFLQSQDPGIAAPRPNLKRKNCKPREYTIEHKNESSVEPHNNETASLGR